MTRKEGAGRVDGCASLICGGWLPQGPGCVAGVRRS